jgi:hypothetical protein
MRIEMYICVSQASATIMYLSTRAMKPPAAVPVMRTKSQPCSRMRWISSIVLSET